MSRAHAVRQVHALRGLKSSGIPGGANHNAACRFLTLHALDNFWPKSAHRLRHKPGPLGHKVRPRNQDSAPVPDGKIRALPTCGSDHRRCAQKNRPGASKGPGRCHTKATRETSHALARSSSRAWLNTLEKSYPRTSKPPTSILRCPGIPSKARANRARPRSPAETLPCSARESHGRSVTTFPVRVARK